MLGAALIRERREEKVFPARRLANDDAPGGKGDPIPFLLGCGVGFFRLVRLLEG